MQGNKKSYQEKVGPESKANVEKANRERVRLVALIDSGQIQFEELVGPRTRSPSDLRNPAPHVALEWIEWVKPFRNVERGFAGATLDAIKQSLNAIWIPVLGNKPLNLITPADVRNVLKSDYLSSLSLKSLQNHVGYLKTVFQICRQ